jgi:hypothetical protein
VVSIAYQECLWVDLEYSTSCLWFTLCALLSAKIVKTAVIDSPPSLGEVTRASFLGAHTTSRTRSHANSALVLARAAQLRAIPQALQSPPNQPLALPPLTPFNTMH